MSSKNRLIQELSKRKEACQLELSSVPINSSDIDVRRHVRLKAKTETYNHAIEIAEAELKSNDSLVIRLENAFHNTLGRRRATEKAVLFQNEMLRLMPELFEAIDPDFDTSELVGKWEARL